MDLITEASHQSSDEDVMMIVDDNDDACMYALLEILDL